MATYFAANPPPGGKPFNSWLTSFWSTLEKSISVPSAMTSEKKDKRIKHSLLLNSHLFNDTYYISTLTNLKKILC